MIELTYPPPKGFLEEETRCEHFISRQKKEVWAVEIDLAQKLLEVCKKYNLKIFADWGTSLGVVRHKGFIPWDDDMDFSMFRDDYEKLCEVAQKEFKYPYCFYVGDDMEGSLISGYAKLRNSNTTAIHKDDQKRILKWNQGIFIDIYPLDNVPDSDFLFKIQKRMARFLVVLACGFSRFSTRYFESSNILMRYPIKMIHKYLWKPSEMLMRLCFTLYLKSTKKYNVKETKRVLSFHLMCVKPRFRSILNEIVEKPFEYTKLPIVQEFDSSLKALYGEDYMVFKKNASMHEGMFFDANRPYTDYVKS